jgi:PEP-CTERM motif
MGKIRTLIMIIISSLMVLTTSGMAGADTIGFTWTDTTSEPWGSDVTYSVSIDTVTGNGTLTVDGWDTDWTLNWVAFQLGGVKFDGSNSFYRVEFDDTNTGTISINFNVSPVTGNIPTDTANQVWSLQAEYSGAPAGNSGKLVTNRLSVTVPEPTTICLLGLGLIGLWGFRKKFKK